jgi:hypothetical protein
MSWPVSSSLITPTASSSISQPFLGGRPDPQGVEASLFGQLGLPDELLRAGFL